jgi:hypothetical protein
MLASTHLSVVRYRPQDLVWLVPLDLDVILRRRVQVPSAWRRGVDRSTWSI